MAIDGVTLGFACLLSVPGMLHMANNKAIAMHALTEAGLSYSQKSVNDEALALSSYYNFLYGMALFELSLLIIGLAIGLIIPLAICAGVSGAISILLMMAITKVGITGIAGISGPPVPARIMLIIIGVLLNVNAVLHAFDGDVDATVWWKFGGLYLISVAIPHLIALKHRKAGWAMPLV